MIQLKLFRRKKEQVEEVIEKEKNIELHIVAEVISATKLGYMRDNGVNITAVHMTLDDAMANLMINPNKCRVIVLEKRRGLFTSTQGVSILNDLLGMSDGISKKFTVFYSNKDIRPDKYKKTKIKWLRYLGIKEITQELLGYNEEYIEGSIEDTEKTGVLKEIDGGDQTSFSDIRGLIVSSKDGELLPSFDIKY